ncbi:MULTISPECIES: hypothetical protein [Streptomyces]|uniref:hypothetical protein n=1 Tax=Streptomyces TaxID=1883 RepID=UPI000BEF5025|nr:MULTISPECIES: hypothetical protein [Streptomyces]UPT43072.1 hypothetical protein MWG59_17770 [Streptomyces sp. WAC00303]WIY77263.1 hypothetical protein QPM16_17545 [Streptomyces anulatus]WTF63180.1 hypothetical protein OH791_19940 [Streptomyces anulatus]
MFDHLEIGVLPRGRRFPPGLRILVNGEDVVESAVGEGGRGPLVGDALPAGGPGLLLATGEARRVELGEPECSGGCCGFLTVVVQRLGGIVQWSDWEVPYEEDAPPEFHFDAEQYDAELARTEGEVGAAR